MILLILSTLLVTFGYYFLKFKYQYWQKRGIPSPKPQFLVGNLGKGFIFKASPGQIYTELYNEYQHEELVGLYRATTPVLLMRDPDLIREVTVKSFNHFRDNDIEIHKKNDPIFGRNPFALKGDEWKTVRGQLTPGFTSGKMKWLYPLLEEVSSKLVDFIDGKPDMTNGRGFEAKELCMRFTLDNVASCAFGLNGRSLEEENSSFRQLAREFFSPDSYGILNFFLMTIWPQIGKIIPIRIISKELERKLTDMTTQTLKYREENNVVRNDFLQILNQLKTSCKDYKFLDVDVAAHASGFFGDGYETSSIVMSFILFELAANPEKQTILREEVNAAFEDSDGKITYDSLQSLTYMDGVVNETLRMHPPLLSLQKQCTKSFPVTLKTGNTVTIEKGTPIILPVYGLHHDKKYYEEPNSFQPERFIGKNRENLTKHTFLAFGEGPRACLGQRFGVLQIKIGLAYIVHHYELSVNKKTQVPIKYEANNALTWAVGGLWLDFKKLA